MAALSGMKEICRYVGRSENTILAWIRDCGFPAVKLNGCWESDTEIIDKWRKLLIDQAIDLSMMAKKLEPEKRKLLRRKKGKKASQ